MTNVTDIINKCDSPSGMWLGVFLAFGGLYYFSVVDHNWWVFFFIALSLWLFAR